VDHSARRIPSIPHEPVSVLIADFRNGTSDPVFDGTLEPLLRFVLEGAGFITAIDRTQISPRLGVRPPETLGEVAARELTVKQGLQVILSGSIDRHATGYTIAVNAAETITGSVICSEMGRTSSKDQVLKVATRLVTAVRKALGDDTSESAQLFAMTSLSVATLD
jgi:hypothetical protein